MEKVLIDTFIVPAASRAEFLEQAKRAQNLVKSLPGFVEGYVYELAEGGSQYNIITTVVWESEEALANARQTVGTEFQKQAFNPEEVARRLGSQRIRATYDRTPY